MTGWKEIHTHHTHTHAHDTHSTPCTSHAKQTHAHHTETTHTSSYTWTPSAFVFPGLHSELNSRIIWSLGNTSSIIFSAPFSKYPFFWQMPSPVRFKISFWSYIHKVLCSLHEKIYDRCRTLFSKAGCIPPVCHAFLNTSNQTVGTYMGAQTLHHILSPPRRTCWASIPQIMGPEGRVTI